MRRQKRFFTLGEITIAIAVLGVGLLGILSVFPVAIQNGARAVKLSDSLHKARAISNLVQTFGIDLTNDTVASGTGVSKIYTVKKTWLGTKLSGWFNDDGDNMDISVNSSVVIPEYLMDHEGNEIKDNADGSISGNLVIGSCMGSENITLKRYFITVNNEFDTMFYAFEKP